MRKLLGILLLLTIGLTASKFDKNRKLCDNRRGAGCTVIGQMYQKGEVIYRDYYMAIKYYGKACDNNHPEGCYRLGLLFQDGEGVKPSYYKAKKYYEIACSLKNKKGCELYFDLKK